MNYVVLNDNEFFENISLSNFKEVQLNDRNRIDAVFGSITKELLESADKDNGGRDIFFREQWLCRDSGVLFMVFRIPQDILYDGTGESIERCLGLFNPEDVYVSEPARSGKENPDAVICHHH